MHKIVCCLYLKRSQAISHKYINLYSFSYLFTMYTFNKTMNFLNIWSWKIFSLQSAISIYFSFTGRRPQMPSSFPVHLVILLARLVKIKISPVLSIEFVSNSNQILVAILAKRNFWEMTWTIPCLIIKYKKCMIINNFYINFI